MNQFYLEEENNNGSQQMVVVDDRSVLDQNKSMNELLYRNQDEQSQQNHNFHNEMEEHQQNQNSQQKGVKRWEYLYQMNSRKQEAREIIKKIVDEEKEDDPNCTFKPNLISQQNVNFGKRDPYETGRMKQKEMEMKITNHKKMKEQIEMQQCTFQPQIQNNNNLSNIFQKNKVNETKGFDSFYRRQMIAKSDKERKDQFYSKGSVYKKSGVTVPKQFQLSGQNPSQLDQQEIKKMNGEFNKVYVSECSFNQAVDYLHNALHNIELE